jgi:hypothetical protein
MPALIQRIELARTILAKRSTEDLAVPNGHTDAHGQTEGSTPGTADASPDRGDPVRE